jgi:hypothetical protein
MDNCSTLLEGENAGVFPLHFFAEYPKNAPPHNRGAGRKDGLARGFCTMESGLHEMDHRFYFRCYNARSCSSRVPAAPRMSTN